MPSCAYLLQSGQPEETPTGAATTASPVATVATVVRLGGSNTMGNELAPKLALGFLSHAGSSDGKIDESGKAKNKIVVSGHVKGELVTFAIDYPGSSAAFQCLGAKACDIGMASRPINGEEIDKLKQEHKEYLFSGITVGAEAGFDDYSMVPTLSQILSQPPNNDPMRAQMLKMFMLAAKLMEEDKAPHGRVGYCALTNAGYSKINPPADINDALAAINRQFIEFWDKQFVDAGIPRSRIYTHVAACARQDESNNAPIRIVFKSLCSAGMDYVPAIHPEKRISTAL